MGLNLDKSAWKRMAFGDVIDNVTDRVDDPSKAGVDRYVGLEHLDPGVMTVRRWDTPDKVEAQKLRFRRGDVIFGRRRAYQKKVAMAEFEGICSAHALVLRARPELMHPDFLPVFLSSDYFLDRAVAISVGSLSPTVNWRDLRVQEFDLPPLDEQQRIAELLWASERHRRAGASLMAAVETTILAFCVDVYEASQRSGIPTPVPDVGEVQVGRAKSPKFTMGESPRPYLAVGNVGTLELNLTRVSQLDFVGLDFDKYRLRPGDVLITEGDLVSPLNVGRPVLYEGDPEDACYQNHLLRLRSHSADPLYLVALIEGMRQRRLFVGSASTTTITSLGMRRFRSLSLNILPPARQQAVAEQLRSLLAARSAAREESLRRQALQQHIVRVALR